MYATPLSRNRNNGVPTVVHAFLGLPLFRGLRRQFFVAAAYVFAGLLAVMLLFIHDYRGALWFPAGIALFACLSYGYAMAVAVFVGSFLLNAAVPEATLFASFGVALGNTAEALLGTWLINTFANGTRALERTADTLRLAFLGAAVPALLSAVVGVFVLSIANFAGIPGFANQTIAEQIALWWWGHAAGVLILTPILLAWRTRKTETMTTRDNRYLFGFLIAPIIAASLLQFGPWEIARYPILPLVAPLFVLLSLRLALNEALLVPVVIGVFGMASMLYGFTMSEFGGHDTGFGVIFFGTLLSVLSITTTIITQTFGHLLSDRETLYCSAKEDRLRASELYEENVKKSTFMSILAHELRTPLASIMAITDLLELENKGKPRCGASRFVRTLSNEARQMSRYIRDLLDISRVTHGGLSVVLAPTDITDVVRRASESTKLILRNAGHSFKVNLPKTVALANIDPQRMEQIIVILLQNSLKYTPRGGEIKLTLTLGQETATISVADNGAGIAAETLPNIFNMFYQEKEEYEQNKTRPSVGLGIGLALAKELAVRQGCAMRAESPGRGQGTTFSVSVPFCRETKTQKVRQTARVESGTQTGTKILVVDDNEDLAAILAKYIKQIGYDCRVAYDGDEALAVVSEWCPAAVIIDLNMPVSGYEFARVIKEERGLADLVLIALSGTEESDEDDANPLGCHFARRLVKPVHLADISSAIAEALKTRRDVDTHGT